MIVNPSTEDIKTVKYLDKITSRKIFQIELWGLGQGPIMPTFWTKISI